MYNVELYLDQFLASLTSQSTGLENVEIILVDDGSTDRTPQIAKAWAAKHPDVIRYVWQQNAKAAEARNTGLKMATGKWIIFPDPDDFLSRNFFAVINREISRRHAQPLLMVSCKLIFFMEATGKRRDTHPLKHRFERDRSTFSTWDINNFIQLSAATACFDREAIVHHGILFDANIKPTFEDGHFVNRILLAEPNRTVIFNSNATYYYRKRENLTSALDGSQKNPDWYTTQLRLGYLDLFKRAIERYGHVPRFLQKTILYDIFWRFRTLLGHEYRASFLTKEQREEFLSLLREIFSYIDESTINDQGMGGLHEEHKIALLGMYKGASRPQPVVYVRQADTKEGELQISHFSATSQSVSPLVNGVSSELQDVSRRRVTFFGQEYYTETRSWVRPRPYDRVSFEVNGVPATIKIGSKAVGTELTLVDAERILRPDTQKDAHSSHAPRRIRRYSTTLAARSKYDQCWLLMDRDDAAGDNAEHLYRYLDNIDHPGRYYFVLRRNSVDWDRLNAEGFKLVEFGTKEHAAAVLNAALVISSHADEFILWPVKASWLRDLATYKFVFLQHGVIHNDLSHWLNHKPIRLLVTSTRDEHKAISLSDGDYVFTQREVKLTGLPRHDALISAESTRDTIMIMPTWRRSLVGNTTGAGMKREKSNTFTQSQFFVEWSKFLKSARLRHIAEQNAKRLVFCPHPNLALYADDFDLPSYFDIKKQLPIDYQGALLNADMLITDFSSIAFDAAYLNRKIVYFQFDKTAFYSEGHFFRQGYFDFDRDGFGPVHRDPEGVLNSMETALSGNEPPEFEKRRLDAFPFRDGRNCQRLYTEILKIG